MINMNQVDRISGGNVVDSDGNKIGKVGQVYLDDRSGEPQWISVSTGLFGTSESFVPLSEATLDGDDVRVPFGKDLVKGAPRVDADQHLDVEQERELYRYYSPDYDRPDDVGTEHAQARSSRGERSEPASAAGTGDAMTRSEEQLKVGTEKQEVGRARLRKHVVTEQQNVTVPVTREQVRVEREPITDANRGDALEGPEIAEAEHEVTLTEERPVVEKEVVPVERVKLAKETVTGEEQVSEEVRKERIETDGDADLNDRGH